MSPTWGPLRFMDLGPETRVKMTGYGSRTSGYVATEIFVIGLPSPYKASVK